MTLTATPPYHLHAIDWFYVQGRGRIAVVDLKSLPDDVTLELGKEVCIDGSWYRLRAVDHPSGGGTRVGLVVDCGH